MNGEMPFREATTADIDSLIGLQRQYYAEEGYPFSEAESRDTVARLINDSLLGRIWVAMAEGVVVGYAAMTLGYSLECRGRDAFVDELYVVPEHRGRGLGHRALGLIEETCRRLRVRALHLEVERGRQEVQRWYRRSGFVDHDRFFMTKRLE